MRDKITGKKKYLILCINICAINFMLKSLSKAGQNMEALTSSTGLVGGNGRHMTWWGNLEEAG
jgi:hypothetical protein